MAVGHAFQHVLEVEERLHVIELCGGQQRGDGRPARRAAVGSGEQVVLPAEGDGADGAFDRVGIEFDAPVIEESAKGAPTGQLCVPKTLPALISRRNHLTSVDHVRTVLLRPGHFGLTIQVEEPT
jgi:hypothetical protein